MKDEIESVILQAADKLFSTYGYQKTTILGIAKESGLSIGTIYSHFQGKKQIFEALNKPELLTIRPHYDEKRECILAKATAMFAKNGYHSTSMAAIASACGFTKPIIYQYFKDKETLFSSIFENHIFMEALDSIIIEESSSPNEVLYQIGSIFFDVFEDNDRKNLVRIIISESSQFPFLSQVIQNQAIHTVAKPLAAYFAHTHNTSTSCNQNPIMAARSFLGILFSFILTDRILNTGSPEFDKHEIISFASSIFCKE